MRRFRISRLNLRDSAVILAALGRRSVLQPIGTGLRFLEIDHPRVCLVIAALVAAAGYAYLLLFPGLVLTGTAGLHAALFDGRAPDWNRALAWSAATGIAALVSYRLFRFRPVPPVGIPLTADCAPALFELIATQNRHYNAPGIDRIVLSDGFELDIVKTPCRGLPVCSAHTLVIGRPLVQYLSAPRFQCALARRLGQFSKRHNGLEHRLHQLRHIWPQYCGRPREPGFGFQPLAWFYRLYAPLYETVTAAAARLDELAADNYAMELFSDAEVLDTITVEAVCRLYLTEKFWPAARRIAASEKQAISSFHSGMVSVLRTGLQDEKAVKWIEQAMTDDTPWDAPVPSLTRRVENIGHMKARMGPVDAESAAAVYLGNTPERSTETADSGARQQVDPLERLRHRLLPLSRRVALAMQRLRRRHAGTAAVPGK